MAPRSRLKNRRYRERDMSGVMNPNLHSGFPRQALHTLSDPLINNTAGRRVWSPEPTVGQGTGAAGRRRPLTNAEMAYNQSNIGSPLRSFQDLMKKWYQLPDGTTTEDTPMTGGFVGDLGTMGEDLTSSMRGQGIVNDATTMARDLRGLTPEELEGYDAILPGPGQYQNPYFGQKQWNPDDIGGQTDRKSVV